MGVEKKILIEKKKKDEDEDKEKEEIYEIGKIENVLKIMKMKEGKVKVMVEGKEREKI